MKLHPGCVLEGTLRLVRLIAEGGMGSVWAAEHLVLGREVAVKVLAKQWAEMPGATARFLREARLTALVDSPHVVRVLDCRLTQADEPYMVLELLHGETLEARVRQRGPLSVFELRSVLEQTCEALGAAHAAGIIHRDMKPENVFLEAGARTAVKLLDFGVARPTDESKWMEVDRLPAGTPQFMSPEHLYSAETADERSDLFSLGAVAYFALTGTVPFVGESLEALYFAAYGADFKRPSETRPELPRAVDTFFEKALAREPEHRFTSAREMSEAFGSALEASRSGRHRVAPAAALEGEQGPASLTLARVPMVRRGPQKIALAVGLLALGGLLAVRAAPELKDASASSQSASSEVEEATGAPVHVTAAVVPAEAPPAEAPPADAPPAEATNAADAFMAPRARAAIAQPQTDAVPRER